MITSYESQTIANGAIQALVNQEIARQNAAREAETARKLEAMERYVRELEERLSAKSKRVDDLCAQLMETLPETYPDPEPGSRLGTTRAQWDGCMTDELIGLLDGLHFHCLPVQDQHMVAHGIQQIPVMGDKDKTLFRGQKRLDNLPALLIQVIGRFVNQKEFISLRKKYGKHDPGPFPLAERSERPVQTLRIHAEQVHLKQDLPLLRFRFPAPAKVFRRLLHVIPAEGIGEIIETRACRNRSPVLIVSHEQIQEGRLAFPVSPDQSQFPVCIYMKRKILKDGVRTAVVGKSQLIHADLRHMFYLPLSGTAPPDRAAFSCPLPR